MISEIPAGRTGDTGQQGARGLQGEPGVPGVCDPSTFTDEQVAALVKRLPPMPPLRVRQIQMLRNADGELVEGESSSDEVYFSRGEGLTIRFLPPE